MRFGSISDFRSACAWSRKCSPPMALTSATKAFTTGWRNLVGNSPIAFVGAHRRAAPGRSRSRRQEACRRQSARVRPVAVRDAFSRAHPGCRRDAAGRGAGPLKRGHMQLKHGRHGASPRGAPTPLGDAVMPRNDLVGDGPCLDPIADRKALQLIPISRSRGDLPGPERRPW